MSGFRRFRFAIILFLIVPLLMSVGCTQAKDMAQLLAEDRLELHLSDLHVEISSGVLLAEAERLSLALSVYGDSEHMVDFPLLRDAIGSGKRFDAGSLSATMDYIMPAPDGSKLLMAKDGITMIYDFESALAKFVVPDKGIDKEYYDRWLFALSAGVDDSGIVWSSDGRYIAVCFSQQILQQMRAGYNMLLINVEYGTVRPLVEGLSAKANTLNGDTGSLGAPFRAVFHPTKPILYYESYGAMIDGNSCNVLRSYNCDTGEVQEISRSDIDLTTLDSRLWFLDSEEIVTTYMSNSPDEGYGLVIYSLDGSSNRISGPTVVQYRERIGRERILDMKLNRGVLLFESGYIAPNRALTSFTIDNLTEDIFMKGIGIVPDAPVNERLVQYDLVEIMDQNSVLFQQYISNDLLIPINAVLSPDGRRLLLSMLSAEHIGTLYLHDFETNVTGQVNIVLPGASAMDGFGIGFPPSGFNRMHQGLRWLENNWIVLDVCGNYYICELE